MPEDREELGIDAVKSDFCFEGSHVVGRFVRIACESFPHPA